MTLRPSELSVAELRRRLLAAERVPSARVMRSLRNDPRQGARDVYAVLKRRADDERARERHGAALLEFERELWSTGYSRVAGVDEVGAGPLAGPVVAAAVVFDPETYVEGVDDSKVLDPETREALAPQIRAVARDWAVGHADVEEINRLNIYHAALLAMRRAVEALAEPPHHVLVDARRIPGIDMPQSPLVKGDARSMSIAAASIIAKTARDALMVELDAAFPEYGFARHKGYCTPEHQEAIRVHGPCVLHRSYTYVRQLTGAYTPSFYGLLEELDEATGTLALDEALAAADDLPPDERRKLMVLANRRRRAMAPPRT